MINVRRNSSSVLTSSPWQQRRAFTVSQTSQVKSATLSGFFHSFLWDVLGPSVSLYLRPCYVVLLVIGTTPTPAGRIPSPGGGECWCGVTSSGYLAGQHAITKPNPAGNHLTGHWDLLSVPHPSLLIAKINSFRSHFSFHPFTRTSPLSHPAQFLLASHFEPRVEVRFPIFKYREIGRTDITGVIIWKVYSTGES